MLFIYVILR